MPKKLSFFEKEQPYFLKKILKYQYFSKLFFICDPNALLLLNSDSQYK
jgi:hypothetical protein